MFFSGQVKVGTVLKSRSLQIKA